KLHDPFGEEDEEPFNYSAYLSDGFAGAINAGDEHHSLREAKASQDWPEWERAIRAELSQLEAMGTWKLVEPPADAIPIANKWVFNKKRNKEGLLTKYKARLVTKGCIQHLGHNYVEIHSPVVHLETIQAILAMVPARKLKICQMDVKGAYLNGMLKECMYMRQLEGYDDGSGWVCLLEKTLYGLRQSGRKWNKEFDRKMKKHGYSQLRSDPCAYIQYIGGEFAIVTVWVDDLLLFATTEGMLESMRNDLHAEWEVTDLGEPSKIVGIEITMTDSAISISQRLYIESILKREGMERANPVGMPMDPNI